MGIIFGGKMSKMAKDIQCDQYYVDTCNKRDMKVTKEMDEELKSKLEETIREGDDTTLTEAKEYVNKMCGEYTINYEDPYTSQSQSDNGGEYFQYYRAYKDDALKARISGMYGITIKMLNSEGSEGDLYVMVYANDTSHAGNTETFSFTVPLSSVFAPYSVLNEISGIETECNYFNTTINQLKAEIEELKAEIEALT